MAPAYMAYLRSWIGTAEVPGAQHNPKIVALWKRAGVPLSTDEDAWCAALTNDVLDEAGYQTPADPYAKVRARSYGEPVARRVTSPQPGDLVLIGKPGAITHVTFYVEDAGERVTCLGGNQSNQVKYSNYAKTGVEGYYRPIKLVAANDSRPPVPPPTPRPPTAEDTQAPEVAGPERSGPHVPTAVWLAFALVVAFAAGKFWSATKWVGRTAWSGVKWVAGRFRR